MLNIIKLKSCYTLISVGFEKKKKWDKLTHDELKENDGEEVVCLDENQLK